MTCPICKEQLEQAIFHGVQIDYCSFCLGMFFDEDELRLAKDDRDQRLTWFNIDLWKDENKFQVQKGQPLKHCPSCRLPLYTALYGDSDITIDLCRNCKGIWLDRGEFKKIMEHLKERANWEIMHNYIRNVAKEAWEVFTGPESFREELLDFLTLLKVLAHKFPRRGE